MVPMNITELVNLVDILVLNVKTMLLIVLNVLTATEDQSPNVHVKKDSLMKTKPNVQLVIVNVNHVVELLIIVLNVKPPEFKDLNQHVVVNLMNSLTHPVFVKLVTTDVPLVLLLTINVKLVLILELQLMNVHVHKDIMKLKDKLFVKFVLHNVSNVKPLPTIVFFVLLIESNLHQNVHVTPVNLILMEIVLIVTGDVLNVTLQPSIVNLVPKTELMLQLVFVQMELMKLKVKENVQIVTKNVKNVLDHLKTV
jgi:hypothetical protein